MPMLKRSRSACTTATAIVETVTRAFPSDYFQQFSSAELLGTSVGGTQSVTFEVLSGSAIIYGAAIDNETGTMSLQIPKGVTD